jgi:hypothetical protein
MSTLNLSIKNFGARWQFLTLKNEIALTPFYIVTIAAANIRLAATYSSQLPGGRRHRISNKPHQKTQCHCDVKTLK